MTTDELLLDKLHQGQDSSQSSGFPRPTVSQLTATKEQVPSLHTQPPPAPQQLTART